MLTEPFAVLWRHRFLILTLAERDVAARYRGSVLGILWALLNPVLMLAVYTFIFGFVFGMRWNAAVESKSEFAILVFSGIIVHSFISECIVRSPGLIVQNASYVKKVVFPVEILAWVMVVSALVQASIATVVLFVVTLFVTGSLSPYVVLSPLVVLPLIVIGLALAWVLSASGVFIRDLGQAMGVVSTVLLFLSPTMYPLSVVPEPYRRFIELNFLTFFMEQLRAVAILGRGPDWVSLAAWGAASVLAAAVALRLFGKARRGFNDVL